MIRCFAVPFLLASAASAEITFSSLLHEMTDRSVVTHWPATEYLSLQASSTNSASKTPDDPNGWFANSDCNFEIRKETNAGRTESVLMEYEGPGVLTRIWTPFFYQGLGDRKGTDIRIHIDGETIPRIQCGMIDLVTGKGFVKPPFAQTTVRAGDLYLPIPFSKSCKVTREGLSFFYIINYRAYAPGSKVESFRPEMLDREAALLETTGKELVNPANFIGGKSLIVEKSIAAGKSAVVDLPGGPSAVRHLEIKLDAANLPLALRSTVLEMRFDGEATVWCPVGDFFSNVNGVDPAHKMWERETRADGTMICRWIMPYQKSGSLRMHNLAGTPVAVKLASSISAWDWSVDSLYFHTNWRTQHRQPQNT
ncbi:MAG: DUF2961 domain-containing protein [Verrucomicrobiota bacterium]